jgi:hypothetical protein
MTAKSKHPARVLIFALAQIKIDPERKPRIYQPFEFTNYSTRAHDADPHRDMPVIAITQPHFTHVPHFHSLN